MNEIIQTCTVILQLATGEPALTMAWPDGMSSRIVCEDTAVEWNQKGIPMGFKATCQPSLPCPKLKDPVPLHDEEEDGE